MSQTGAAFTLAHFSDPHLSASMPRPRVHELKAKRALGYLSWRLRRRAVHGGPVLDALVADLRQAAPDHVVVTGDITNISLPEEFARAGRWLRALGDPRHVSVIPGNHDAYVGVPWEKSLAEWSLFMTGAPPWPDDGSAVERPVAHLEDFPFVRRRGPVAIIGLSTALPTPIGSAAGRIGPRQIGLLKDRLEALASRAVFRVVLIHHPPVGHASRPSRSLLDSEAFQAVIASHGAELVLHGHTHRSLLTHLPSPAGPVPVIGVPSASARAHGRKDHARYHLYRIRRAADRWEMEVEVRGVAPSLDRFVVEDRFLQAIPA
ncbi:MAG: metallophosphoesterase [Rhodospirillaceae bacterium]|nr:metallophosphoesterase [Rhodospirillaceae bacterium]